MVAGVDVPTAAVVTVNVAVVFPVVTVTEAGTEAAALLLDRVTSAPPEGAAELRVMVAWELFPPVSDVGFRLTEFSNAEVTESVAVWEAPFALAVIVAGVEADTEVVETVNVALALP
jgi:hypothetical protein